jgi:chromosome segregation ATPase
MLSYGDAMSSQIAFAQFQEKNSGAEERATSLQHELDDLRSELSRARQREALSDEHNTRLTETIDKLLNDSNDRLQLHLTERMHALEEKNTLALECDKLRRQLEESVGERERAAIECDRITAELEAVRRENQALAVRLKELTATYAATVKANSQLTSGLSTLARKQKQLEQQQLDQHQQQLLQKQQQHQLLLQQHQQKTATVNGHEPTTINTATENHRYVCIFDKK